MVLKRPAGMRNEHWDSITIHERRLVLAAEGDDHGLTVGLAKDLVECIAKVVCNETATVFPRDDFKKTAALSQVAVDRKAGAGGAQAGAIRTLASGMSKFVGHLSDARNEFGAGHGRPVLGDCSSEESDLAAEFARTWSAWMLSCLERTLRDDVSELVRELSLENFYAGLLAKRLRSLALDELGIEDQHRIGVAVGRRALRGTFVVANDGVRPLSSDPQLFPEGYRIGVADGLLFDETGSLVEFERFFDEVVSILASIPEEASLALLKRASASPWSRTLSTEAGKRRELVASFGPATKALPKSLWSDWDALRSWISDEDEIDGGPESWFEES